ncbi:MULTISPECIES: COX15/CtaA family protein [Nocardioides]|uniref:COX15/CtaA family protein n=1 Tax=Nocardioides TaxID=1839 RepID=UPI00032F1027|nr:MULTISPECIES: COX15/CtaA family protein [Nocardioides]EON23896.1 cytochrome oxidase assembly [Nocardioides sp. CF8]
MPALHRFAWPLAIANLVANIGIVVTGGAVRLTDSGLGCPTWPRCTEESYVPHGALGIHGAIEFGNRMLTWVLVAVAIASFLSLWRSDRARATRLAAIIAIGVPAQGIVGGITVLTDLNPWIVSLHLLLSMAMIGVCVLLLDELRGPVRAASPRLRRLAWLVFATTWVVLYLGTVVTGSGPHSGDLESRRTGLDPQVMSHVHAAAVYLLLALTFGLVLVAQRRGATLVRNAVGALLVLELAQGLLGFVQYFTDLPEVLVALHMLGAALISAAVTWAVLSTGARASAEEQRV